MIFIGIDPGKNGAAVAICDAGLFVDECQFSKATDHDQYVWLEAVLQNCTSSQVAAYVEDVHSSPQMGVKSAFTFGRGLGFLHGLLTSSSVPYVTVTPAKWQKVMQCRTQGDKNVTKAAAQRLFPTQKIIHANADAFLIAEYGRRHWKREV